LLLSGIPITAQRKIEPTDSFIIKGKIQQRKKITLADLNKDARIPVGDQLIYNHRVKSKTRSKIAKAFF